MIRFSLGPRLKLPISWGGRLLCLLWLLFPASPVLYGEPYFSSRHGFRFDLPPGYRAWENQGNRLSFRNSQDSVFEIALIPGPGEPGALLEQTILRLKGGGELEQFEYRGRKAALGRLEFSAAGGGNSRSPGSGRASAGWGLCVDRGGDLLLALAYGPGENGQEALHLSCLDSIAPTGAEQYYWGPVTEFTWPRGEERETPLYNSRITAAIGERDAEAAQGLVDREFLVLRGFEKSPHWQEAWRRFYRMIRRDSWERLRDALFQLERHWSAEALLSRGGLQGTTGETGGAAGFGPGGLSDRELASRALAYVQGFRYERDLMGSDFVNLVSAATEGRGDCDSRALLWALFLAQAGVDAGIMVSRDYGHAMGIADIEGPGARFPFNNKHYLTAETTAPVELGLIAQNTSEISKWLGVDF